MIALLQLNLRRERWILPIWMLGIVGLLAASGAAVAREFGSEQDRLALAAVAAGNPAFLFLRGLPDGSSVGGLMFFQTFSFLAVLAALMNTFLVVRQTRADEERGRVELLGSALRSPAHPLLSTLIVACVANTLVAAGCAAVCLSLDIEAGSSLLVGAAVGGVGVAFAGIAALLAQMVPSPRAANGAAAAVVGAAYVIRGVGDALGTVRDVTHTDPHWLALLSPIGWAQAIAPFSTATPLPLVGLLALALVTAGLAVVIRLRRDLGASLIPERPGDPAWAHPSSLGLGFRMQRASLIGWGVGGALLGVIAGVISPLVVSAVESNAGLVGLIGRLEPGLDLDIASIFAVAILGIAGFLAAAAGVQAVIRARVEESEDRAEWVLSTRLDRARWLSTHLIVAVTSMAVVAATAGLAAGIGFVVTGADASRIPESLAAIAVHLPAGSVFVAATALVFAVLPRLTAALGWGLLVAGLVLGQFGGLIGLPEWIQSASPFHHVPAVPLETVEPGPIILFLAISVLAVALSLALFRRRDVPA